ncbi:MAG TPA: hypothetical protein VGH81_05670 [Rudaea sp.]|jgi:hypothetical protein
MRCLPIACAVLLIGWFALPAAAQGTSVRVAATDPPGDVVTLGRNQNFYLLLEYETQQPVRIWARPYFQGKEVNAGSNPSGDQRGTGRTLGWFFLMHPGDQVDEVRINAGDGSPAGTHLVATYPVQITAGDQPAATRVEPPWVSELDARDQAEQRAAYEKQMSTPPSSGELALFSGFMLLMVAAGFFGFAAPALALWRWRGGWRVAAAVPAALMAFVVLRLFADTARDPTSHNLWPFEILQAGALSIVVIAALFAVRRFAAVRS